MISLDLFLAVQCCGLCNFSERNHHLTHPRVTARGGDYCAAMTKKKKGGGTHTLTHTETQRGRLWTACGRRRVDGKTSQTTPTTTSTTPNTPTIGRR